MEPSDLSLYDQQRLEKIDKLTELGVGEYIALPQLVVVGDQSSGKSSVLEGLTKLPFPRDSSLCTRFATRIVFRRCWNEKIVISIIPHQSNSDSRREQLRAFHFDVPVLTPARFKEVLEKACIAMNVPGPGEAPVADQPAFSQDILNIELTGPNRSQLSVIDVPGIFRSPNPPLTTPTDMIMVRRMVHDFIKESRTVMLAVLPANVDIATQEILELAGEVDPKGDRTLGVLTKPDLIEPGTEQDVIELIQGKRKPLKLGYYVVRNRKHSEREVTSATRNENERAYFQAGPFSKIKKNRVGMVALENGLQLLLRHITQREFPQVRKELEKRLNECLDELESLGPSRSDEHEQRKFLMSISESYQDAVSCAKDAQYGRNKYLEDPQSIRLATKIVDANTAYSDYMLKRGHITAFSSELEDDERPIGQAEVKSGGNDNSSESGESHPHSYQSTPGSVDSSDKIMLGSIDPSHELYDTFSSELTDVKVGTEDINTWLTNEYRACRGFELGTFNPSILPTIFRKFTENWEPITLAYLGETVRTVHDFSYGVLEHYIRDNRVLVSLWSALREELHERYLLAQEKAKFLLHVERRGTILTTNHYFAQALERLKRKQMEQMLAKHMKGDKKHGKNDFAGFLNDANQSNEEHAVSMIHDTLQAYYKVARKRLVDAVCMQGTDYHLISGPDAALRRFCPDYVLNLTPQQLEAITGEDFIRVERRNALKRQIDSLRKGKAVLIK